MKSVHLLGLSAAAAATLILAASAADAAGGQRSPPPRHGGHHHGKPVFHVPIFVVERQAPVIIEREVVREVPVIVEAPEPPPPPREAYVIGKTYASLPGACMKLIEAGASYYLCSGEWYRQVGRQYRAVEGPS